MTEMNTNPGSAARIEDHRALIVSRRDLERLEQLIRIDDARFGVHVSCRDGLDRNFPDVADLLKYDNTKRRSIDRVVLASRSPQTTATITIQEQKFVTVEARLSGPEEIVLERRQAILDLLDDMTAWYSWFVKVDFTTVTLYAAMLLFLAAAVVVPPRFESELNTGQIRLPLAVSVMTLAILGGYIFAHIAGTKLNELRSHLFPVAEFLIGHGQARYNTREKVRWGVVVAGGLSLLASLLVTLILS